MLCLLFPVLNSHFDGSNYLALCIEPPLGDSVVYIVGQKENWTQLFLIQCSIINSIINPVINGANLFIRILILEVKGQVSLFV